MKVVDNPPSRRRGKVDWLEVAETARENPGKWVEVPQLLTSGMITQIYRRQVRGIDPDEFEVTTTRSKSNPSKRRFYLRLKDG